MPGLVRPILEYCSPVWDPYSIIKYTSNIEKVQRRAARFVFNRYHNMSSPTDMIRQLEWESLEQHRRKARLTMFYKIQHGLVAVPLPAIVTRALRPRPGYPHQYQTNYYRTDSYKNSFFPLAIKQWNTLPSSSLLRAPYLFSRMPSHLTPSNHHFLSLFLTHC